MNAERDVFHAPFHPARAALLLRPFYALLAADIWLAMVQHGARYGIGGFNVAHFAWLDSLLPVPSASLYVGLLIASGALASLLAMGPVAVPLRLLLAAMYTFAWILSVHDSYQHHYLLSWIMVWLSACPSPSRADLRAGTLVRGWGVPMTAITCAIVYVFTGISKSEPEWRSGEVLRKLGGSSGRSAAGKLDGPRDVLMSLGLDESSAWVMLSLLTIALQWLIASGYVASLRRDASPSRLRAALATAGLVGAIAFHGMAEIFDLFEIGMFSYYMIGIALVLLGPVRALSPVARLIAWAGESFADSLPSTAAASVRVRVSGAILAAVLLGAVGFLIPLPGAQVATMSVGGLVILCTLLAGRDAVVRHEALARGALLTALALFLALSRSAVPFDYYRRGAGELSRMGRHREALEMYQEAERHAPPGQTRIDHIRELESILRSGSGGSQP